MLDEPISPELCLVSPDLAEWARGSLPEPAPAPRAVLRAPRATVTQGTYAPVRSSGRRPRLLRPLATAFFAVTAFVALAAVYPGQVDQLGVTPAAVRTSAAPLPRPPLVVPNACGQAYVFVKGLLEEAGFAWRVVPVGRGYSSDTVVGQSPAPGTAVADTGAPTITLTLAPNPSYTESGAPDPAAPYAGTAVKVVSAASAGAPCT